MGLNKFFKTNIYIYIFEDLKEYVYELFDEFIKSIFCIRFSAIRCHKGHKGRPGNSGHASLPNHLPKENRVKTNPSLGVVLSNLVIFGLFPNLNCTALQTANFS